MLPAGNHPGHVDVVVGEDLLGLLYGGRGQGALPAQDPGKVDVEKPQDVRAGIHQGRVDIVRGQDPVGGVGQDYGIGKHKTTSKPHHLVAISNLMSFESSPHTSHTHHMNNLSPAWQGS